MHDRITPKERTSSSKFNLNKIAEDVVCNASLVAFMFMGLYGFVVLLTNK